MGFNYELLKSFSDYIGIDLELITENRFDHALLHAKYFNNSRSSIIVKCDLYALNTGKVSVYDDIIREYSVSIKWDWRLLASLICQESRFDPNVKSLSGA